MIKVALSSVIIAGVGKILFWIECLNNDRRCSGRRICAMPGKPPVLQKALQRFSLADLKKTAIKNRQIYGSSIDMRRAGCHTSQIAWGQKIKKGIRGGLWEKAIKRTQNPQNCVSFARQYYRRGFYSCKAEGIFAC